MQCEIDPFCQTVLKHHFPDVTLYGDIRDIDGTEWKGKVDILTGGFPCQPFSQAGKRKGVDDNRFLWPEMLRVIQEIQPTWIVAENVRGLLTLQDGVVFEQVCTDLEANGYEVQPLCIPACATGAPHRRDRIWFIAHSNRHGDRQQKRRGNEEKKEVSNINRQKHESTRQPIGAINAGRCDGHDASNANDSGDRTPKCETNGYRKKEDEGRGKQPQYGACGSSGDAADTRCELWEQGGKGKPERSSGDARGCYKQDWGEGWLQAATRLCGVDDGLPRELDGITVPKWRKESLKAYGNAIVPQVAHRLFQNIMTCH